MRCVRSAICFRGLGALKTIPLDALLCGVQCYPYELPCLHHVLSVSLLLWSYWRCHQMVCSEGTFSQMRA